MELLFVALLGYAAIVGSRWLRAHWRMQCDAGRRRQQIAAAVKLAADRRQADLFALEGRRKLQNQRMQLALLQLEEAPDFRRAAHFAAQATDVPLEFRQRQFQRFRPLLVRHFAARLAAHIDAGRLTRSLEDLTAGLGMAPFEAEYIEAEARRHSERSSASGSNFAAEMTAAQTEHERRLSALNGLDGISGELRDQLTEAEEARFRETMLRLNEGTFSQRAESIAREG